MTAGLELRLARLFERGRAFVVAFDHGLVMGPMKGIEDAALAVSRIAKQGPDALQMTPAMLEVVKQNFMSRSSPMLIARLDTANVWRHYKEYGTGYHALVYGVRDAVRCGADAVVAYLVVGYGEDWVEGKNLEILAKIRDEAEEYGLPFIVEPLFVEHGQDSVRQNEHVRYVSRLASEVGAHLLKVDYTGDKQGFRDVVRSSFAPILIRGGPKTNTDAEFLHMLSEALEAGAKGVTVGRNLWQNPDPAELARKIAGIVHTTV
ncbi:aldolase [Candidatus Marsarchaeota G2 archaeon OSP_D]|jgi:DhnA-type fructose-1,6-bisphosphate aldolase and related enzymes|uniref:Aldolase n=2 Tax=Candidatus Marsarchaeota group 2 TaxID=2203771 RepID=A0A2R6AVC3_9ARCH|nr:MAG: aldolase [Candidatus Marsarchaeota G2 archaeon OSP_D]